MQSSSCPAGTSLPPLQSPFKAPQSSAAVDRVLHWRPMICIPISSTRSKTRPHNAIPQLSIICFIRGTHLALIDFSLSLQSAHSDSVCLRGDRILFGEGCSERTQARLWSGFRLWLGEGEAARGSVMGMHARDLMGILLMMLMFTEATRKYMTMKDLARMQAEAERLTSMFELNQLQLASRRLLAPPAVKTNVDSPLLCQSPGMDCLPGEEVRCEMGRHEGCDCEYIQSCFPRASQCTFFNATHVRTCGF